MKPIVILAAAPVGWLDRGARDVAAAITATNGPGRVTVVGSLELAAATWSHRIVDGAASTVVRLQNGSTIDSEQTGAVLNLIRWLSPSAFSQSTIRDRAYAESEQQALFVSFLRSFPCRVINNVDGQGPLGMWSPLRWATLAQRCGIEVAEDGVSTGTRLLRDRARTALSSAARSHPTTLVTVVGERVFGADTPLHARQCRRLARTARCDLLGLRFAADGRRELVSADPFPAIDGRIADAVGRLLCDRAASAAEPIAS
jgi:hypothetical protein